MAFETLNAAASIYRAFGLRHVLVNYDVFNASLNRSAPSPARPARPAQPPRHAAPAAPVGAPQKGKPSRKAAFSPIPRDKWPLPWEEQFRKTRPGLVAWTYWNLGRDLLKTDTSVESSEKRKIRSRIIQRLIRDLGNPAGTHTFWPLHLDASSSPSGNPDLFWSGIRELGCRGVIVFGSEGARKIIPEGRLEPFMQVRIGGTLVWIVKELESIEDPDFYPFMLPWLKTQLQTLMRA